MVLYATFNNISVILWQSVLLVEENKVPGENHRSAESHWQTLSHNVVSSTHHLIFLFARFIFIKRNFKRYWSKPPPISINRTITSHFKSMSIKNTTTYDVGNWILSWDRHIYVAGLNRDIFLHDWDNNRTFWTGKWINNILNIWSGWWYQFLDKCTF